MYICISTCISIYFDQKVSWPCKKTHKHARSKSWRMSSIVLFVIIRVISKMPVITWSPSELIKSCPVYLSTCRIHLSSGSTWKIRRKQQNMWEHTIIHWEWIHLSTFHLNVCSFWNNMAILGMNCAYLCFPCLPLSDAKVFYESSGSIVCIFCVRRPPHPK